MIDDIQDLTEYTKGFYAGKFKKTRIEQGAIYRIKVFARGGEPRLRLFIVLTAECDIRQDKLGDTIIVAPLLPINVVCSKWAKEAQRRHRLKKPKKAPLKREELIRMFTNDMLTNNTTRYRFLPGIEGSMPHSFASFDLVTGILDEELKSGTKIAVLKSPHKEAFSVQFAHLIGRVGTPALARESRQQLLEELTKANPKVWQDPEGSPA